MKRERRVQFPADERFQYSSRRWKTTGMVNEEWRKPQPRIFMRRATANGELLACEAALAETPSGSVVPKVCKAGGKWLPGQTGPHKGWFWRNNMKLYLEPSCETTI